MADREEILFVGFIAALETLTSADAIWLCLQTAFRNQPDSLLQTRFDYMF